MHLPSASPSKYLLLLPFALLYLLYLSGHFMGIMEIDAAQYAAISKEMYEGGWWLQTYQHGQDYLDKPPLLFWTSIVAFKIFGVNDFAYRFFPVLISLLGAYSTYRLARLYYEERVAYWAALMLASCQAVILMNHDVRTDNMLTSFVAFSLWQLAAYLKGQQWKHLIGGFAGIGLAMLAKGPIGLIIPVLCFGPELLYRRAWGKIFDWRYLVGLVVTALVLLPMCIGLYEQFDMHPEKIVNGQQQVSGLKFFFWTQSFGRITGENVWANNPDPFFLVHTTLWSFLPWSFFLVIAYIAETKVLIQALRRKETFPELFIWAGYTLTFIALSQSKYQLNHYIYPIYSLGAILTAKWIVRLADWSPAWQRFANFWLIFQTALLIALAGLLTWAFPNAHWAVLSALVLGFGLCFYLFFTLKDLPARWVYVALAGGITINILMNLHFYPSLLRYQVESELVQHLKKNPAKYGNAPFGFLGEGLTHNALNFYSDASVPYIPDWSALPSGRHWILCNEANREALAGTGIRILQEEPWQDYPITELSPEFLNPQSRSNVLRKVYLVEVEKE